jgi:hypothetical protein
MTSERLSIEQFSKIYFAGWEVEQALKNDNPIQKLIHFARQSRRGQGCPDGLSYMTYPDIIEIYQPETSLLDEPDCKIKIQAIAETRIEMISQPTLL